MIEKLHKKILSKITLIILWSIALVYLIVFLKIVVFKNGFTNEFRSISFIPFQFVEDFFRADTSLDVFLKNVLGNIAIFIPMGILLPVFFNSINFKKSILICFTISLIIEISQYIIGMGMTDIDDLILNTLGGVVGSFIYFKILKKVDKKLSSKLATIAFLILFGITGLTMLWLYQPNILPTNNVIINQEILEGLDIDSFDLDVICTEIEENTLNVSADSYDKNINVIEDSEIIVDNSTKYFSRKIELKYGPKGNIQKSFIKYETSTKEDLENLIDQKGKIRLKLWLIDDEKCDIILILK